MAGVSRRKATIGLAGGLVGAIGLAGLTRCGAHRLAGGHAPLLGAITGNDPAGFTRFTRWLGRAPGIMLLALDQTSPAAFTASIAYELEQAGKFMALGTRIAWAVPTPGGGQLEAIAAGAYDAAYGRLFAGIAAQTPPAMGGIVLRLPWEFNLAEQENAARDRAGHWHAPLFIAAWRHLALLARQASPRFLRVWCPNVQRHDIDPEACWPGDDVVEIVGQDCYVQRQYDPPGAFAWFLAADRGLAWGADFARRHGKLYALPEWGMDSDLFAADLVAAADWLDRLGPLLHHHCWWDRPEEIDCRISDGTHPLLGRAYRASFGPTNN